GLGGSGCGGRRPLGAGGLQQGNCRKGNGCPDGRPVAGAEAGGWRVLLVCWHWTVGGWICLLPRLAGSVPGGKVSCTAGTDEEEYRPAGPGNFQFGPLLSMAALSPCDQRAGSGQVQLTIEGALGALTVHAGDSHARSTS